MNQSNFGLLPLQDDVYRSEKLQHICMLHEINDLFASKLRQLEGFDIVIVADDSGSMNSPANSVGMNPYGIRATRWDELKKTSGIIIDIASTMATHGVDVYFLNRPPVIGVISHEQLDSTFSVKPNGYTPIVPILQQIFNTSPKYEKKRLVILLTDGRPTDANGHENIPSFKNVLLYGRRHNDYVNIIACTDDDETMSYLNNWDIKIPRLDVIDDYGSEYLEIKRVQGSGFAFSYGDYVVKSMLGSIDKWFDSLDEVNVVTGKRIDDDCCNII